MNKIKISQHIMPSPYPWLDTLLLVDDATAEKLSRWTVGYFRCTHCNTFQEFAYQLPEYDPTSDGSSAQAHNDRNKFWREHHHGDGRIILFKKDVEVSP